MQAESLPDSTLTAHVDQVGLLSVLHSLNRELSRPFLLHHPKSHAGQRLLVFTLFSTQLPRFPRPGFLKPEIAPITAQSLLACQVKSDGGGGGVVTVLDKAPERGQVAKWSHFSLTSLELHSDLRNQKRPIADFENRR